VASAAFVRVPEKNIKKVREEVIKKSMKLNFDLCSILKSPFYDGLLIFLSLNILFKFRINALEYILAANLE
jgi:hypothetical protein